MQGQFVSTKYFINFSLSSFSFSPSRYCLFLYKVNQTSFYAALSLFLRKVLHFEAIPKSSNKNNTKTTLKVSHLHYLDEVKT